MSGRPCGRRPHGLPLIQNPCELPQAVRNQEERRPEKLQGSKKMRLKVILEPSDEGGYTVFVPSLPGCISEGASVEEALENIKEAIELYLEPVEDDWVMEENAAVQEIEV